MKHRTLIFLPLAYLLTASQGSDSPFQVTSQSAVLKEGSCVELSLTSKRPVQPTAWFWTKDGNRSASQDNGTVVILSSDSRRAVHPDFAGRAKSRGSPPLRWHSGTSLVVLMCDVKKSDSGKYAFVYQLLSVANVSTWAEVSTRVTVEDNPCPISFPPMRTLKANERMKLTCRTVATCTLPLQFLDDSLAFPLSEKRQVGRELSGTLRPRWQNDGKKIACQTRGNTDKYLRKYITAKILYGTRNVRAGFPEGVTFFREGENMTLVCAADGNPAPVFKWYRNDQELPAREANWTVPSVSTRHNGMYKCLAKNDLATGESTLKVDIRYPATVSIGHSRTTYEQGEAMTLSCDVKRANPKARRFQWTKDDHDRYMADNNEYTVLSMQPEDAGLYKCIAFNGLGSDGMFSAPAQLLIHVEYRPRKTSLRMRASNSTELRAGSYAVLQCRTDAKPLPYRYTWSMVEDGRERLSGWWSHYTDSYLEMVNVLPIHSGCYVCGATNKVGAGDRSQPLCLQVLYGPKNMVLLMPDTVTEGEMVSVNCTVESVPYSIVTLSGMPGDQSSVRSDASDGADETPLTTLSYSFRATPAHAGLYTCQAINSQGRQSMEKMLNVKYAPQDVAVKAHPSLMVAQNRTVTLRCDAKSYPPVASVTWWKLNGSGYQKESHGQILTLTSVTLDNAGFYGCTAANEMGSARSPPVEVHVLRVEEAAATFDTDFFVRFIVPVICVITAGVFLFIYCLKMRRVWHRRHQGMMNIVADLQSNQLGADSGYILFSAEKDRSATNMLYEGSLSDDYVSHTKYTQGKYPMHDKEKHLKQVCTYKRRDDSSDEDNIHLASLSI